MLTQRQLQLFEFIKGYVSQNRIAPTFDEMAAAVGHKSKSGIHAILSRLEDRGFIRRLPGKARAIEIIRQ